MGFFTFFFALVFLGTLEFLVFFPDWHKVSFLLLGCVLFGAQRLAIGNFSRKSTLLLFFGISSWSLMFFIDSETEQHVFSVLSAIVFGMIVWANKHWREDRFAAMEKSVFSAATIATVFIFFAVITGVMVNYALPIFWSVAGAGLGTYALMRQYFFGAIADARRAKVYAIITGIFFAESFWVIQFWPFGYLTTAAILLIFFFVLWDFFDSYSEGGVSWHRVGADFLILIVLTGLLLGTTRWAPIA